MITEIAILYIKENESNLFESAFGKAQTIIASMKGYIEHELQKCMGQENKYVLIVRWQSLEDHTKGFRKHEKYTEWKGLLHQFYEPFPIVEHYQKVS
ncbi:MAG: antibiotic biosynthesis monooxygenase [Ginsengibacter sp.]